MSLCRDRATSSRCARSTALGVTSAVVPETFPLWLADQLRADGVELTVDGEFFDDRRRVKTRRRARRHPPRAARRRGRDGRGARAACGAPSRTATGLELDGEPLTVERVKAAMRAGLRRARRDAADDFIVAPGPQGAVGHDMGSGPIRAGEPIVIDIWPRDNESFACSRHDAHVRRRRGPGRGARVAPPLQGGARPRGLRDQGRVRRPVDLRRHVRDLRGGRRPDAAHEGRRASRSRTASSTGSATASGSRCTRQPGIGLAVEDDARRRRRRHRRAGPLPRRATAACGSRTSCSSPRTAPRT